MPYAAPFLRLVASGTLYTSEQWSFGLSFVGAAGTPPTTVPTAVIDALKAFHLRAACPSSSASALTLVKLNKIGVDGRYTEPKSVQAEIAAGFTGGSTTRVPAQISLAVTLDTGFRTGPAAKGRFYVPVPVAALGDDGRITAGEAGNLAGAAKTLIDALNAAGIGRCSVVSDTGAGAARPVKSLRVGRVLDTIRSRRTSLPEGYTVASAIAGADTFNGGGVGGGF